MTNADTTISVQPSMMEEIARAATRQGTTVEQFVNVTLSEKLAALRSLELLRERAANGDRSAIGRTLQLSQGNDPPREGDELP